jgi:hypothetical protein
VVNPDAVADARQGTWCGSGRCAGDGIRRGTLQDSTFYWGDDFVLSVDPLGDRTPGPGHDDVQWYIRRVRDSSVVYQGRHGRWMPPGDDPDWRLDDLREETSWEVKTASDAKGWSVEIRLPVQWFGDTTGRRAGAIGF